MHSKDHWEKVYSTKAPEGVSWFQPHADMSMRLIHGSGLNKDAATLFYEAYKRAMTVSVWPTHLPSPR